MLRVLAGTPRVLGLVWQAHRGLAIVLFVLGVTQGLVPLGQVWIMKWLVDLVATTVRGGTSLAPGVLQHALQLLALQATVALANQTFDPATRLVQQELTDHVSRQINLQVLRKANSLADISFFESPRFYDMLQRAQQDAAWRPTNMLQQLSWILRAVISLVSMFGVLLAFQPLLALAVVVLVLPNVAVQFRHQRQSWGMHDMEVPEVRLMGYFQRILATKEQAKEIRLFGLGDYFLNRYVQMFDAYHHRHRRLRFRQWRTSTLVAALSAIGTAGAYVYVVLQALASSITLGSLTLYIGAVNQVQSGLSNIVMQAAALYESNLFVSRLFEMLDLPPAMALPPPGQAMPVPAQLRQGIEFRHVAFTYPGAERPVLEDVSFAIGPEQTVALVGANGAGKTTLVKLLARLYDPTSGQILVEGIDLRDYDLDAWRNRAAVVLQDFAHYHLVARENIGLGRVEQVQDQAAIEAAAARGGADSVVAKLPDGYDTLLGRMFWSMSSTTRTIRVEEGVDISGGEWQKIALARAFMRTNEPATNGSGRGADAGDPANGNGRHAREQTGGADGAPGSAPPAQLLILDEPTAALDAEAEYQVYRRFHELTQGKATLLISHRFSTVKMADHIIVLENGRIIEQGSHRDLLALGGRYAALYEMQAERYRE